MLTDYDPSAIVTTVEFQEHVVRRWRGSELSTLLARATNNGPVDREALRAVRDLCHLSTKLVGEAGEAADDLGKYMRGDKLDRRTVALELGDTLWYVTALAGVLGFTLSDIMRLNIEKLEARHGQNV